MASENGIVGEENKVVDKVENDFELVSKDEEEEKEVVEEKETEKAKNNGEGEEKEGEEVGEEDGENGDEEEEEEKSGEKVVAKKRKRGSGVKKAPNTPIERPSRERKTVERYMEMSDSKSSAGKAVLIEKVLALNLLIVSSYLNLLLISLV